MGRSCERGHGRRKGRLCGTGTCRLLRHLPRNDEEGPRKRRVLLGLVRDAGDIKTVEEGRDDDLHELRLGGGDGCQPALGDEAPHAEVGEGLLRQALALHAMNEIGDCPEIRRSDADDRLLPRGCRLRRARLWERRHCWSSASAGRNRILENCKARRVIQKGGKPEEPKPDPRRTSLERARA